MAVVRITKDLRSQIIWRALADAFDAREKKLNGYEHGLAFDAYDRVFGKKDLATINALPKKWFDVNSFIEINCFGPRVRLQFGECVRLPPRACSGHEIYHIDDRDFTTELLRHKDERQAFKLEKERADTALTNLIIKCSTLKILTEQWPEGREYYKHLETLAPQVPMIKTEEVNKLLGLPK